MHQRERITGRINCYLPILIFGDPSGVNEVSSEKQSIGYRYRYIDIDI